LPSKTTLLRVGRARSQSLLAELIWNGLDSDACRIDVELAHDDLAGGLSRIIIYDDGSGLPRAEAMRCSAIWAVRGNARRGAPGKPAG